MIYKNEARLIFNHFETKRKESASLLFLKFIKFITAYDTSFNDIMKARYVIKTENEKLKN